MPGQANNKKKRKTSPTSASVWACHQPPHPATGSAPWRSGSSNSSVPAKLYADAGLNDSSRILHSQGLGLDVLLTGDQSRQLVWLNRHTELDVHAPHPQALQEATPAADDVASGFAKEQVKTQEKDIHMYEYGCMLAMLLMFGNTRERYVERELARRTGRAINDDAREEDDLIVPDNLKVCDGC